MTKDDTVKHLISIGYDAYLDDGVVMVRTTDLRETYTRKVQKELAKIGYNNSFGFKYTKPADVS